MHCRRNKALYIVVVLAWTNRLSDSATSCPKFFVSATYRYTTHGSSCYVLYPDEKTWQDADLFCKNSAPNGRLAKIDSALIMSDVGSKILSLYSSNSRTWIGGYSPDFIENNSSIRSWYWSSYQEWPFNEEKVNSSLWAANQPQYGNNSCMAVSSGLLYSRNCNQLHRFLCSYDCMQTLKTGGSEVTITSPGFPRSSYPSYTRCEWFIDVTIPPAVLEISRFYTEASFDALIIKEMRNSTNVLWNMSGNSLKQKVTSPTQYMYLLFTSDGIANYRGFSLKVHSLSVVPVTRLTGNGIITSYFFPMNYPNNSTEKWLLSVANGTIILNFTDFNLQPGDGSQCTFDKLLIREGGPGGRLIGTFCGDQKPQNIISTTGVLYLQMDTDIETTATGFRAVYRRKEDQCVHVVSSSFGNITSPDFPSSYPPNLKCAWYIDVLDGVAILNFSNFSLSGDFLSSCGDKVEVYGGFQDNETQLAESCSTLRQRRLESTSRYITIFMKTDQSFSDEGFAATFRRSTNCSFVYRQESGMITSPDYPSYYNPYTHCSWLIDVRNGTALLQFTNMNMFNSTECTIDSIEIFDGKTDDSPSLRKLCKMRKPITVNASSQYLFVRMRTGQYSYGSGFTAMFHSSNNDCPSFASNEFYAHYLSWNGNCYGLSMSEYRWETGRDTCEKLGASLLFIESAEELNAISGWLSQSFSFIPSTWTGAFRRRAGIPPWLWSTNTGDVIINKGISSLFTGEDTLITNYVFLMDNALYLGSNLYISYQIMCKVKSRRNTSIDQPKAPCAAPPNIHSGYYTPTQLTFPSGIHANYYCEQGYELSGNGTITCENGFWNGTLPKCLSKAASGEERSKCSLPPITQYTIYKPILSVYDNGASLSFGCHGNYQLTSNSSITCLDGIWQGILPSCIDTTTMAADIISKSEKEKLTIPCHQPEIKHASYFPSTGTYANGSEILVFCKAEGIRSIYGNLTCMNGSWSGNIPICYDEKTANSKFSSGQISSPEMHSSQGFTGNNSVVLPVTVTLIVVLLAVIVGGVIYFVIYRRRANPPRPLVEMQ